MIEEQATEEQAEDEQTTDGQESESDEYTFGEVGGFGTEEDGPEPERRFFSRAERFVLQAMAGARCESCGASLTRGFHADHRRPYSAGGPTDLTNAQALCPHCNRRKGVRETQSPAETTTMEAATAEAEADQTVGDQTEGNRMEIQAGTITSRTALPTQTTLPARADAGGTPLPHWPLTLRPWQQEGLQTWQRVRQSGGNDMTVTATPGSGKTDLALTLAREEFHNGRADLLVVVCPTRVLKAQWAQAAHRAGLELTADWGNGTVAPPADAHGCVVTYQQVAALPEALRLLWARRHVIAVMDEVHHCATSLAWGDALHAALEHAKARICLSGTAWRADGARIPFVRHDEHGRSVSDVEYDYAQALADGVLREAFFFALGARVSWLDERGERGATFADPLNGRDRARRLRAALDPQGGWLPDMLAQANAALAQARAGHPSAKGLAVAMDAAHARAVAGLLQSVTGEAPALALSDDPASQSTLERFRSGRERWLVVCRMAGEGYDCPDIRAVAWATNVVSEGAFRQVVARSLRVTPGLVRQGSPVSQNSPVYQDALVFLPADGRLVSMARALVGGRSQVPSAAVAFGLGDGNEEGEEGAENRAGRDGIGRGLFVPLESRPVGRSVVTGGAVLPASALERARTMNASHPGAPPIPDHALAAALARLGNEPLPVVTPSTPGGNEGTPFGEEDDPGDQDDPGEPGDYGGEIFDQGGTDDTIINDTTDAPQPYGQFQADDQSQTSDPARTYDPTQTYDQRRRSLRRICTRLTALIARELDVNPAVVHRAFHRRLGDRQAEATIAGLEQRKRLLEDKLRQLRIGA